jgi:alpha-glucosidase (family GH31 glycosyl hydrolase)
MIGYRIFTVDQNIYKGLGTYMKEMRKKGLRLVLILDPGLVIERNNSFYMTGVEKDVYVKWPNNLAPYDKDNINQNPDDVIRYILLLKYEFLKDI